TSTAIRTDLPPPPMKGSGGAAGAIVPSRNIPRAAKTLRRPLRIAENHAPWWFRVARLPASPELRAAFRAHRPRHDRALHQNDHRRIAARTGGNTERKPKLAPSGVLNRHDHPVD